MTYLTRLTHVMIFVFWLVHWLPLPILALFGRLLGMFCYVFIVPRRRIAAKNLKLCFPELDDRARRRLLRRHFQAFGRSMFERGILWWASPKRFRRIVRFKGEEQMRALVQAGTPVIVVAPHFVGLDMGGSRAGMSFDGASVYARQDNDLVFDAWLRRGRLRFGNQILLEKDEGIRGAVKALKSGRPFYYLPDMDLGCKDAIFVPFFGVEASTVTGLSRIARLTGAKVLPSVTRMLSGGGGYVLEIGEAWENFPTDDVEADTRKMNAWIESAVRTMPEQYYWIHRRFRTRPDGEAYLY
ncbi:MAG: lipid A biosynthesis acyltransferase [Azoarcus sp.]|jgi:KDO2-lipid IV(A) lauroyltransferase|nr:lipid A biosynthesis acyltransferase [Azoarcus sp.]